MLTRQLNVGFSEAKKKNEILQMKILDQPSNSRWDRLWIDIDALKIVANGVNSSRDKNRAFLIITHYQRLLNYIGRFCHVLSEGPSQIRQYRAGKIRKSGYKGIV